MTSKDYEMFFDLLQKIIDDPTCHTFQEKKQKLLDAANEDDEGNLEELSSWF